MCGKSFNHYLTHKKTHQYRCGGKKKEKLSPKNSENYCICKNPDISEIKLHNAIKPIIQKMLTNAESFIAEYKLKNGWQQEIERKNNLVKDMDKMDSLLTEKHKLKQRIIRKILENHEDEKDLNDILSDGKNEIQERLEYHNKKEEWFEAILEVEKQYRNGIDNLNEKQWMDLTHKFVNKIYIEEKNIRVMMRVGKV